MNIVSIALVMFIGCLVIIEILLYVYRTVKSPDSKKVRKRLRATYVYEQAPGSVDITRKRKYSDIKTAIRARCDGT